MRATISFDIGLDRVSQTMVSLVVEEANVIHQALERIETTGAHTLAEDIDAALENLTAATSQLQQYRQMLTSFERAKFGTMLPQDAPATVGVESTIATPATPVPPSMGEVVRNIAELQSTLGSMNEFGSFLDKLNGSREQEGTDELQPKEG